MLKVIIKYQFKMILRVKEFIFWCLLFPILLSTLYQMTFTNVLEEEVFETIPIAVVDRGEENKYDSFLSALYSVSDNVDSKETEEDILFSLQEVSWKEAEELLQNGEVKGYILLEDEIQLVAKENGISSTVIKSFIDYYKQRESTIIHLMEETKGQITEEQLKTALDTKEFLKTVKVSESAPNLVVNYFYTILAMTAMFSAMVGVSQVTNIQANQSPVAARINLVPRSKMKIFIGNIIAVMFVQIVIITVVFAYLYFVLKVDFGKNYKLVLLTNVVGVIVGVLLGTAFSALIRKDENFKSNILSAIIMLGCFFAGMMNVQMKYKVQENVPILGKINPVNRLTDAYYSLYYYDTYTRYWQNITALVIIGLILLFITFIALGRQRYESI